MLKNLYKNDNVESVELSSQSGKELSANTSDEHILFQQKFPLDGIPFTGERLLKLPDMLYRMTKTNTYSYVVSIFVPFYLIILVTDKPLSDTNIYVEVFSITPILILIIFELQFFDRFLFKKLVFSFQYWFTFLFIVVHTIATFLHFLTTSQHQDTPVSTRKTLLRSIPLFISCYIFGLSLDAHIYRSRNNVRLSVILFTLFANGVRWFVANQYYDKHEEIEVYEICLIECTSANSIRSSSLFVLTLLFGRMFYTSVTSDRAVILNAHYTTVVNENSINRYSTSNVFNYTADTESLKALEPPLPLILLGDQTKARQLDNVVGKDMLLNIKILYKIGSKTKFYFPFVILWMCVVGLITEFGSKLGALPVSFWICLNFVQVFILAVESATRINKHLFATLWTHFEAWYLFLWCFIWTFAVCYRSYHRDQPWDNESSLYFLGPMVFLANIFLICVDAHRGSLVFKRTFIALFFVFVNIRIIAIRLNPANQASLCLIWCGDTGGLEQSALVNFWVFQLKYLFFITVRPTELLIIRSYLRAVPLTRSIEEVVSETRSNANQSSNYNFDENSESNA